MKYKNSIQNSITINASKETIWNFISSPGYLNKCHPFCKKNKIIKWEKDNHSDILEYLNGLIYIRKFINWKENKGYTLLIGEENKQKSMVKWEITPHKKNTSLSITVYPYFLNNYPKIISYLPYKIVVTPKLESYLHSVLTGIKYYLDKGIPVEKNMFGSHKWFS